MISMFALLALATTLYCEAATESTNGMLAVASVIYNEAKKTEAPYEKVCRNPNRYSCWRNIELFEIDYESDAWKRAKSIAKLMLEDRFAPCGPWTHFYNPKVSSPRWADKLLEVRDIGNHRFGVLEE